MHNRAEIEAPCKMSWDDMQGSDKVRHCSKCRFNVYNFNEMTQDEIDELLSTEDRVCGRLFVRPDGTYMTKSCRKKSKRRKVLAAVAVIITVPLSILMIKGESLQDFCAREEEKYRPQLQGYRNALDAMGEADIACALFFTALGAIHGLDGVKPVIEGE